MLRSSRLAGLLALFFTGLFSYGAHAAAFLEASITGEPYRWQKPITLRVDNDVVKGGASPIDNTQGRALIQLALDAWSNIPQVSGLDLTLGSNLTEDINGANFTNFIQFDAATGEATSVTGENLIIFDSDGQILEALVGEGNAGNVLGVATPAGFNDEDMSIEAGFVIINGGISSVDSDSIRSTVTHELGHFFNLAHTQLAVDEASDEDPGNDAAIPTMYPIIPQDKTVSFDLHRDDIASLVKLYPNATALESIPSISGQVFRRDGRPVESVNIVCESLDDPAANSVSAISDQVQAGDGRFECLNLAQNRYQVRVESVELTIATWDPVAPFIVEEYYSGSTETGDPLIDVPTDATTVDLTSVTQEVSDINIVLNEDGRLRANEPVSGTLTGNTTAFPYRLYVPANVQTVELSLEAEDTRRDLDLFVRANGDFSLADNGEGLGAFTLGLADVSSIGNTGSELITLGGSSGNALTPGEYQIMLLNFSGVSAPYTLVARMTGSVGDLVFQQKADQSISDDGTQVSTRYNLWSSGDKYSLQSIVLTETGSTDFSLITRARLFLDMDGDKAFSPSDFQLGGDATLDPTAKTISFSGIDLLVDDIGIERVFLVYDVTSLPAQTAKVPLPLAIALAMLMIGVVMGCFGPLRKNAWPAMKMFLPLSVMMSAALSCGGSRNTPSGYDPKVLDASTIVTSSFTFAEPASATMNVADSALSVANYFD